MMREKMACGPALAKISWVVKIAARSLGIQPHVLRASTDHDIETAFVTLVQQRIGALLIGTSPFLNGRSEQLAALTVRHAVPAIYQVREFTAAGGLMSYGASLMEAYRQFGIYTGRILKGDKPADLPVQRQSKFELVINLKTAQALGLTIPPTLLFQADEVIR